MIRASEVHRICTNRPIVDLNALEAARIALEEKVQVPVDINNYEEFLDLRGAITLAKAYEKQVKLLEAYENDELPSGAKNYLKNLYLKNEYGVELEENFTLSQNVISLRKGILCEQQAIEMYNSLKSCSYQKNKERRDKDFLTGEPDIITTYGIIDIKVCSNFITFKAKTDISEEYKWQLIAYCHLFDKTSGRIAYFLLPTPEELLPGYVGEEERNNFLRIQENISKIPVKNRVKTFDLITEDFESDKEFMLNRLFLAKEYYNNLNIEEALNISL